MKQCTCYALRAIDCTCPPVEGELYDPQPKAEQEPKCPDCGAVALYECVACSSNNYPEGFVQPKREWVGLNWDDLPEIYVGDTAFLHGAKWAEVKLKEKNGA